MKTAERDDLMAFVVDEALGWEQPDIRHDGREVWQVEYYKMRNALVELRKLLATEVNQ